MLMEVNNVIFQLLQVYMLDMYFDEKSNSILMIIGF